MKFLTELGRKTVISTRFFSVFGASMVAMTTSYILILTDNVVAGQLVSDEAVAAMSLVFPLLPMLFFVSYLIADGLGMMAAYAQGKDDRIAVNRFSVRGQYYLWVWGYVCLCFFGVFRRKFWPFGKYHRS